MGDEIAVDLDLLKQALSDLGRIADTLEQLEAEVWEIQTTLRESVEALEGDAT